MKKPEISRFAFAMFDVLGFSAWVESAGLSSVLDSYQILIERAVIEPTENGSLSTVQLDDGMVFAVTSPPHYAYFSDTILLWCPLVPALVGDLVERCRELICQALAMGIPLRGALTLGDAVLDNDANVFLGEPIIEAARLEKAQNWIGLTLGNSAVWAPFLAQLHGTTIIEYAPPIKENTAIAVPPIVIDWPRRWRDNHGVCPSLKLRELNKQPSFSKYWENTIAFAQFSGARHDWHLRPQEIPSDAFLKVVSRNEVRFH